MFLRRIYDFFDKYSIVFAILGLLIIGVLMALAGIWGYEESFPH